MPLPPDSTLSLLPHTNPGESDYSKPKQAMIVRMSPETLDALQSYNGLLDFDFGDTPGIYIGTAFYSINSLREDTPHELYLRTTSATKQSASLKHYANVTGKLTVERQLDRVKDMLRERTSDAAKQREDRKTIFMDTPPSLPPANSKKRKEPPSMFRNVIRPSDQAKLNAAISSSAGTANISAPVPPRKKPSDFSPSLRGRLIHYMASSERSQEVIVRIIAGPDCDSSSRREVLELLEEVGEPTSTLKRGEDPGTKMWRLKTEAWKEVRPFEWPKLVDQERIALARTGRQKLSSLGVKPSDALWNNFVHRSLANNAAAESFVKANEPKAGETLPKRGVSSKELKAKKAKPKADPNAEIQMKNESVKTVPPTGNGNGGEKGSIAAMLPASKSTTIIGRKLPGSGFKMGKATPNERESPEGANNGSLPRDKSVGVRTGSGSSPPTKPPALVSPPRGGKEAGPAQRLRKIRESELTTAGTESDREKSSDRPRGVGKSRSGKEQAVEERRRADGKETTSLKRKLVTHGEGDSEMTTPRLTQQKKRKIDTAAAPATAPGKDKDISLSTKPDLGLPRTKVKREPSPLPQPSPLPRFKKEATSKLSRPVRDTKDTSSSTQSRGRSDSSKINGASKPRRKSPIYTSSEDEGEIRQPKRENSSAPQPGPSSTSPPANDTTQSPPYSRPHAVSRQKLLPTDHTALRTRYKSTYGEYLAVYHKVWTQRGKIQNLLEHGDGYGSTAESDGGELMDSEDLSRLSLDYQRLHEELMTMRSVFDKASD